VPVTPGVARRGFTLVELTVGLVCAVAVSGVAYRLLLVNQRVARVQAQRTDLQDNVRAGALIVASELRELGFDSVPESAGLGLPGMASSDILIGEPGRIRYRAPRGLGFTCAAPTTAQIVLRTATWLGERVPVAQVDSLALFVDGDPGLFSDDTWVRAGITGVSAGSCADGAPAIALATSWEAAAAVAAAAVARTVTGGPARIFEIMELQYYRQAGASWLGLRSVSRGEVIQPFIGPLADSSGGRRGFTLGYLDRADDPTAAMSAVRTVTIGLRGVTAEPGHSAQLHRPTVDTLVLTTRVALRNMMRP
jgi:hypothetical protein